MSVHLLVILRIETSDGLCTCDSYKKVSDLVSSCGYGSMVADPYLAVSLSSRYPRSRSFLETLLHWDSYLCALNPLV